jgi:hypothetical protein
MRRFENDLVRVFSDYNTIVDLEKMFDQTHQNRLDAMINDYFTQNGAHEIFTTHFSLKSTNTARILQGTNRLFLAYIVNSLVYARITYALESAGVYRHFISVRDWVDGAESFYIFFRYQRTLSFLLHWLDFFTVRRDEGSNSRRSLSNHEKGRMIAFFFYVDSSSDSFYRRRYADFRSHGRTTSTGQGP